MSMQKGGRTGSPRNPAFAACKGTGGSREPSVPAGIDAELGKSRQVEKEAEFDLQATQVYASQMVTE